ncbi:MAG TPA: hypothetical protein DEP84_19260 [Chloroflexi bacterium]|nr:hypothetical protein [Chloroflexota bacterium]
MPGYSLSGVWCVLRRCGLKLHSARVQYFSPDPEYQPKVEQLLAVLAQAPARPEQVVLPFLDEMGFYRWPVATR